MALHEVKGDVLLTRAQTIVQGVAPGENMPTGIAKELRKRFPELVPEFKRACRSCQLKPGGIHLWKGPEKWILNLLTQDAAYTRDVRTTRAHARFLRKSLRKAREQYAALGITSMAMPRICSGLGKMRWDEVRQVIDAEWSGLPIPIFLYVDWVPGHPSEQERDIILNYQRP